MLINPGVFAIPRKRGLPAVLLIDHPLDPYIHGAGAQTVKAEKQHAAGNLHAYAVDGKQRAEQFLVRKRGQRRKIRAYNENAMLVEVGFDTGAVGAAHSHPHTQISYVLDGEFTYTVEGVTRSMKKGDSIAVEGGKVHGCACVKAGTLLDIFTPMREDFVR